MPTTKCHVHFVPLHKIESVPNRVPPEEQRPLKALDDIRSQIKGTVLGGPPTPHTGQTRGRARIRQPGRVRGPRALEQGGQGINIAVECVSLSPATSWAGTASTCPAWRLLPSLDDACDVTAAPHGQRCPSLSTSRAHTPHVRTEPNERVCRSRQS